MGVGSLNYFSVIIEEFIDSGISGNIFMHNLASDETFVSINHCKYN